MPSKHNPINLLNRQKRNASCSPFLNGSSSFPAKLVSMVLQLRKLLANLVIYFYSQFMFLSLSRKISYILSSKMVFMVVPCLYVGNGKSICIPIEEVPRRAVMPSIVGAIGPRGKIIILVAKHRKFRTVSKSFQSIKILILKF